MHAKQWFIIIIYFTAGVTASWDVLTNKGIKSQWDEEEEEDIGIPLESYQRNSIVPIVKCPAGTFRGSLRYTRGGKRYFEFQSIPYAEPPKRFE
ncbi:unnamed protein product, partial [Allacma fusca]